jgi:hypothetical protein
MLRAPDLAREDHDERHGRDGRRPSDRARAPFPMPALVIPAHME